jgi:hypothetical protein
MLRIKTRPEGGASAMYLQGYLAHKKMPIPLGPT